MKQRKYKTYQTGKRKYRYGQHYNCLPKMDFVKLKKKVFGSLFFDKKPSGEKELKEKLQKALEQEDPKAKQYFEDLQRLMLRVPQDKQAEKQFYKRPIKGAYKFTEPLSKEEEDKKERRDIFKQEKGLAKEFGYELGYRSSYNPVKTLEYTNDRLTKELRLLVDDLEKTKSDREQHIIKQKIYHQRRLIYNNLRLIDIYINTKKAREKEKQLTLSSNPLDKIAEEGQIRLYFDDKGKLKAFGGIHKAKDIKSGKAWKQLKEAFE